MEHQPLETITEHQSLETTKDVPTELMHLIQSFLWEKEAARTCVLSKSWLHAWSTIPFLRFPLSHYLTPIDYKEVIYDTIQRYHNHSIPIQALKFYLIVENPELDEIWMRSILTSETRSCLKELSLWIEGGKKSVVFTFSDDILFSGENLHTIEVRESCCTATINVGMNPVIKCICLRVLKLNGVNISEDIFHNLVSTCSLLEKVVLFNCRGLKTIKIKHLGFLRQLEITSSEEDDLLEIDNVPSLGSFYYRTFGKLNKFLPFKTTDATASSLGRSITQLHLERITIDSTFLEMIKLKFPYLESLNLEIWGGVSERLVINSLSLKRLILWVLQGQSPINVQVYAPNLLSFNYGHKTLPTLLFPTTIALKQIKLSVDLRKSLDTSFFLKLRELLTLSSKFDIHIELSYNHESLLNTDDVDDLRRRVMFPVTNVQQLSLTICLADGIIIEYARVFDAFFSICHPIHVKVFNYNKCFSKLTVRGMMENNTTHLIKDVQMKNPRTGRFESLTSSWESDVLDTYDVEFKLNWFSHD